MSDGEPPEPPELAELRAAFARGDYRATRAGARRLTATAKDEGVRAAAKELEARTGASGAMIAVYLVAAAIVVATCGYWLVHGR